MNIDYLAITTYCLHMSFIFVDLYMYYYYYLFYTTSYVLNAYLYCVNALVGGVISIRDPYICAVSRVCANESHAVFNGPVVCAVKT